MAFEPISKEEAIERHRMIWNWIADETLKQKAIVYKEDAFEHFKWDWDKTLEGCWCCHYAIIERNKNTYNKGTVVCDYCPLKWSHNRCNYNGEFFKGLYSKWHIATINNNYKKAAKIARKITNLPERKD